MGVKITPREKRRHAACRLFSREVIFTRAHVSLALLSLRKNGGLLVVYQLLNIVIPIISSLRTPGSFCKPEKGWYGQPKYCYEKANVVMISFAVVLGLLIFWFLI